MTRMSNRKTRRTGRRTYSDELKAEAAEESRKLVLKADELRGVVESNQKEMAKYELLIAQAKNELAGLTAKISGKETHLAGLEDKLADIRRHVA